MNTEAKVSLHDGYGTTRYRNYVLFALLVIYIINVIDRILFALVQEQIKAELVISDFQLGLLGGPAFALLYSLSGLPIARIADRSSRVSIVAIGAAFWSFATALCGLAQSYFQLLGLRILVGIGEAACVPPSHSLISDYFPARRRASAIGIYGLGIPIGSMIAALAGGWIAANFGWRLGFIILGLPGILAAVLLRLTVKDPPRLASAPQKENMFSAFKTLIDKPSFRHMSFGGALMALYLYSVNQFLVSFMVRKFGIGIDTAATAFGLVIVVAVGGGIFLGGFISDRMREREPRAITWLPAIGCLVSTPLFLLAFSQDGFLMMVAVVSAAMLFTYFYMSPTFTVVQIVAGSKLRATASALSLLISTMIGYGLGPPLIGGIADHFRAKYLASTAYTPEFCDTSLQVAQCANAGAYGLQIALTSSVIFIVWASLHFWMAGRTLHADQSDHVATAPTSASPMATEGA